MFTKFLKHLLKETLSEVKDFFLALGYYGGFFIERIFIPLSFIATVWLVLSLIFG